MVLSEDILEENTNFWKYNYSIVNNYTWYQFM